MCFGTTQLSYYRKLMHITAGNFIVVMIIQQCILNIEVMSFQRIKEYTVKELSQVDTSGLSVF